MRKFVGSPGSFVGSLWSRLTPLAGVAAVVVGLSVVPSQTVIAQKNNPKVTVCHANGQGVFTALTISASALPAHAAHGDGLPGGAVPGMPGYQFDASCTAVQPQPDFEPFYIRNTNGTIAAPWDSDLVITENAAGDGFSAMTPRGGQKVGYGTNFFDGLPLSSVQSADWDQVSGPASPRPYLNIWVTDGNRYAVIASENDYRGTDFQTRTEWKVFETNFSDLNWLCSTGSGSRVDQYLHCNGARATFADLPVHVTIMSPSSYPAPEVGTGAPRGGFGLNVIWGDTQANFVNGPYQFENLSVTVGGIVYFAQ
jgi:hypothetical protein